ncbi:FXJ1B protein, partial [Pachycephala philippinensis]|nr:FXJ1B protein [Pachycephala philippinensis]
FQCPGFPLTAEELCDYIDIPRHSSSGTCPSSAAVSAAPAWPPPLPGDIDYTSKARVKPPYSYATLIAMAMEASKKPKITLAAICKWISDNFSYFRRADPSWQSSIRHNLCINKRFVKVPREKGEPGRGAFWKLHPRYAEQLKNSTSKEWGTLPEHVPATSTQRGQQESRRVLSPSALGSSCQSSIEVGAELQQLLREFEEFESSHNWNPTEHGEGQQQPEQPWPTAPAPAEASWLPSPASAPQEEPSELTELTGCTDWETLLNSSLDAGEFSALGQLELSPGSQPGAFPLPCTAPGQQRVLPGGSPTKPASDETLMATAFLEAAWHEETGENLSSGVFAGHGAENIQASLLEGDAIDWDSLDPLG